jgi:Uma2 family endonuclease
MTAALLTEPVLEAVVPNNEETFYEEVDGQRVEMPPMSAFATLIAFELARRLSNFGEAQNLGRGIHETLLHLPLPKARNRRPDAAFVSFDRWPQQRPIPPGNAWDVVPELAVEVVSPTDGVEELMDKITEYFQAGVQLVWVVFPDNRLIHVYESLTKIRVLTMTDELDGGTVLPGFRLAVSALLPPGTEALDSGNFTSAG